MTATQTVAQQFRLRKSQETNSNRAHLPQFKETSTLKPRHGVITLSGYGIAVRVDRGHLMLEDGIGADRSQCRLPRVNHGLRRLVVIGSDGMVSLAALRWLADQDASFVMLDRDGSVLVTTVPVRSSNPKLRRAQAMAMQNGVALRISRELIDRKLAGQEKVAIEKLKDESAASTIRQLRAEIAETESLDAVRLVESKAAKIYWSAWRTLSIMFPRKELSSVPEHWRTFGLRVSSLTGSPRSATNPVNAILNYLYAMLEAESRLAAATLGLDPGLGVLHADIAYRDNLACDLMEPIRPQVDGFVLDWLLREPLSRSFFFEQRDGKCRLMAPFASMLSQTALKWAHGVAPVAEWLAQEVFINGNSRRHNLPARLTQKYRREVNGADPHSRMPVFKTDTVCHNCGNEIERPRIYCDPCAKKMSAERITEAARLGRMTTLRPEAQVKRAATQRINTQARWDWKPSDQPSWLTNDFYSTRIHPVLASLTISSIAKCLDVSYGYADQVRKGRIPHPRRWLALAELAGMNRK